MDRCDQGGIPAGSAPNPAEALVAALASAPPAAAGQRAQPAAARSLQNGMRQSDDKAATPGRHADGQATTAAGLPEFSPLPDAGAAALRRGNAMPAAEAEPAGSTACAEQEGHLRMEHFSNGQARLLSWLVFAASLVLLGATVALVCLK